MDSRVKGGIYLIDGTQFAGKSNFISSVAKTFTGGEMNKIIVIAEDYDDARAYMKILIESYGYEVYEAANGREAIEVAKKHHPDLILMDISMPLMDGLTATQIIRTSIEEISTVPIIAITAFGDNAKEKALEAGCNDLIPKPVEFDTLQPIIEKYIVH